MKWLMREKFYFASPKLTQAAFVMVDTISDTDLQELNQLSEQIKHLIGADDDVTLNEMKTFVKQYVFGHESIPIPTETMELLSKRLSELHPQKIQSTPYQTESVGMTTEEAAKRATEGFVFFGEKFTLDSYLFDLMTAGSAEQEFAEKPNIQTALMIPDVLADNAIAHQLVLLWLNEKLQQGKILENASQGKHQLSRYDAMKEQAKAKIDALFNDDTITDNVYHKWLKMLGLLIQAPLENAPYFRLDALYQLKNLVAYLGSYTELKHDTLLYVKQAYAEMGAGGDDSCKIYVENPPLPIPKGYVESEPEFLDKLIQLNEETLPYFDATSEQHKFVEFGTILKRLKEISIKQMHNEIISDEDFEWLRLLPQRKLPDLLQPTKTVGEPTIKEHRVALIADIFTSEGGNPLYEAIGRPALMLLMVNDVNGARVVI
jgi:hypothetical protein